MIKTIEDCLELLVGLQDDPNNQFELLEVDGTILSSIGRQVCKGIALTDRQLDVVKNKLSTTYRSQFNYYNEFDKCLGMLRMPLREIDRTHYIKLIKEKDESFIAIRFPFSKRLITVIESIAYKCRKEYSHDKGSHIHKFKLTEHTVYNVIEELKNKKSFDIDEELTTLYEKIKLIKESPENYIPGVYRLELKNLPQRSIDYIISNVGDPKETELFKFKDNSIKYGLEYFDQADLDQSINVLSPLTQKIVRRKNNIIFIDKKIWSLNSITAALLELNRFPLLIVLPEDTAHDEMVKTHDEFKGFILNSEISVMFRLDNDAEGRSFNEYVKTKHINNKVANHTKVVYISNTKYPKPLILSAWTSSTVLYIGSSRNSKVDNIAFENDLVIHYDTDVTPMSRGFNINIEKI